MPTCCLTQQVCIDTSALCHNTSRTIPRQVLPADTPASTLPGSLSPQACNACSVSASLQRLPGSLDSVLDPSRFVKQPSLGVHWDFTWLINHVPPHGCCARTSWLHPNGVSFSPPFYSQSRSLELDVVELSSASSGSLPFQQWPQRELN